MSVIGLIDDIISISASFLNGYTKRKFITHFGVTVQIVGTIWLILVRNGIGKSEMKLKYLLWTLYFLKLYPLQEEACSRLKIHHNTWSVNVWDSIDILYYNLNLV